MGGYPGYWVGLLAVIGMSVLLGGTGGRVQGMGSYSSGEKHIFRDCWLNSFFLILIFI